MVSSRLPGHSLTSEGKPFAWSDVSGRYVRTYPAHEKQGRGLCECGEVSPVMISDAARKRWHTAHKESARKAALERLSVSSAQVRSGPIDI